MYISWTSFSSHHTNVVAQHWGLGLYMDRQQRTAANLTLTHSTLHSSYNTFKRVWKLDAPPVCNLQSTLSITQFSTSNEKFLGSQVGSPLSRLPCLSVCHNFHLCTQQQIYLHCPIMGVHCSWTALHFKYNESKYSVQKMYIFTTFFVHLTLCMYACFCPAEQLIAEHVTKMVNNAH